jgi:hypothetical protein
MQKSASVTEEQYKTFLVRLAKDLQLTQKDFDPCNQDDPLARLVHGAAKFAFQGRPKGHIKARDRGMSYQFLVNVFLPLLFCVPIIVITWLNPCLNYVSSLDITTAVLFTTAFLFAMTHNIVYTSVTFFCNPTILCHHGLHVLILFSSMGATLAFYNLYTYDPSFFYFLAAFASSIACLVEYFICMFQRHHFYYCNDYTCDRQMERVISNAYAYTWEQLFTAFTVIFILCWLGVILVPVLLSYQLYTESPGRSLTACVALS